MPYLKKDEFCEALVTKAEVAYASQCRKEESIASYYDGLNTDGYTFKNIMEMKRQATDHTHAYMDAYVELHEAYIDSALNVEQAEQHAIDLLFAYDEKPEPKECFEAYFSTHVSDLIVNCDISLNERAPDDDRFDSDLIMASRGNKRKHDAEKAITSTLVRTRSGLIPIISFPEGEQTAGSQDDESGFYIERSDEENRADDNGPSMKEVNSKRIRFFDRRDSIRKGQVSLRIDQDQPGFLC